MDKKHTKYEEVGDQSVKELKVERPQLQIIKGIIEIKT